MASPTSVMPVLCPSSTLVLDNGGCSLKAGFSNAAKARIVPNAICKAKSEKRRAFVGDQVGQPLGTIKRKAVPRPDMSVAAILVPVDISFCVPM